LRPRTRTAEAKDKEDKFAKRTHLNHVKSEDCLFQHKRKQNGHGKGGAKVLSDRE
jgi:hypothetical protein